MRHLLSIATVSLSMAVSGFAQDTAISDHPVIVKRLILKNQTASLGPPYIGITFFTPDHEAVYRVTCGVQPSNEAQGFPQLGIIVFQTASVVTGTYQILGSYIPPSKGPNGGTGSGGSYSFLGSPETTFTFSTAAPTSGTPIPYDMYIIVEEL
jgi:hypothetical protein